MIIISKLFYLAGGMGKFGIEQFDKSNKWRVDIKNQIEEISCGKVKCCNPNDHFNFLEVGYKTQREPMEYDLHRIKNSDLIIVNFNDPDSIGTASELAIAYDRRIPIIGLCENGEENKLHPWLKEFCNRIFNDREDLILYVIQHYVNDD